MGISISVRLLLLRLRRRYLIYCFLLFIEKRERERESSCFHPFFRQYKITNSFHFLSYLGLGPVYKKTKGKKNFLLIIK